MSVGQTGDDALLRDLTETLSGGWSDAPRSLGIVGQPARAPQPPGHCLRACLAGDPHASEARGCAFLQAAARNAADAAGSTCTCARGFQAAAQPITIGGRPATLVTVAGAQPGEGQPLAPLLLGQLDAAARLVQRIGQLVEENSGFANEVLQNYEQLNLIFDLTQQIAHVTDAQVIERLLLQRVARLLQARTLLLVTSGGTVQLHETGERSPAPAGAVAPPALLPAVSEAVDFVRRTRQVRVVAAAEGRQVIAGPLVRLDERVDVIVAERAREAYSAGDMMLVESMLSFGGQIISNTELHERLRRMSLEVTRAMVAAIDKKDHYTSGHSERGGFLTRLTAQQMGLSPAEQQTMEWAGLLHDIGKIGIPEEILCKPGKLTPEEFERIKQHPRMGYEILKPIASFEMVLDGVLHHHEYPDGSGYPDGLKGDAIPLVARIIHVVDTFDALTSTRAYRQAFSVDKALEIIAQEKGRRIDPQAADAFFAALAAYRGAEPADFAVRFGRGQPTQEVQNVPG